MQFGQLKRREFITLIGGAAVAWPLPAHAQHPERMRRIGVLMNAIPDSDQKVSIDVFRQALQQLGWTEGRNMQIDIRWAGGDAAESRRHAEGCCPPPDVIVVTGNAGMPPILRTTSTIPIVFNNIADPVGAGFVESLARPGGNATGFLQFEYTLSGKWLGLLKEIAPQVNRVAVLRDATLTAGVGQFAVIQSVAPSVGMEVTAIGLRDASEIERAVAKLPKVPNGGLILTSSALSVVHRGLVVARAAQFNLPTIYYRRFFVSAGGLISYGYDVVEQFRGAAGYVDRILKGEKPADLPVQAPTKYEMVINLKTAKTLGITVPPMLLARADEVIE